jgi:hypothetical protein
LLAVVLVEDFPIDYRCDDEKKKLVSWGDILVSLRAEDPKIPDMPFIHPLQAHVYPHTKKTILHGLSIPNPNFSELAFFFLVNRSAD